MKDWLLRVYSFDRQFFKSLLVIGVAALLVWLYRVLFN